MWTSACEYFSIVSAWYPAIPAIPDGPTLPEWDDWNSKGGWDLVADTKVTQSTWHKAIGKVHGSTIGRQNQSGSGDDTEEVSRLVGAIEDLLKSTSHGDDCTDA